MNDQANPSISVGGLRFEWDLDGGRVLASGNPVIALWTETTMARFLLAIHKMVGTDRFNLALYGSGEATAAAEWAQFVEPAGSVEEGLRAVCRMAHLLGLGHWEVVTLDRANKELRFRTKNSWESVYQRAIGVSWGSSSLAGRFAAYAKRIFGENCWADQTAFTTNGDAWDEFVARPSDRTVDAQLEVLITADKATRADLDAALDRLKQEIHERKQAEERLKREIHDRKQAEQTLLDKLEIIRRQEDSIRAMSTPILQLWEGVLALPVIGLVDNARANQMMESLLDAIVKTQARFTILDLTGVDAMDTSAADHLLKVVRAARLLGTRCVISGISPDMAQTVVGLELDLAELSSFSTLESALRYTLR